MKCPSCNIAIRLETEQRAYRQRKAKDAIHNGIEVAYGLCPECEQMIILVRKGKYQVIDDSGELSEGSDPIIVYPQFQNRCTDMEVPENYRLHFNEACAVLVSSPKASAALSRRLVQLILRCEYKVKPGNLAKEIDEILSRNDMPSNLKQEIDAIRNIGNFAAHPNKYENTGEIVDVEPGEAEWLIAILEHIFDHKFISPLKDQARRDKLNTKLQELGKPLMK